MRRYTTGREGRGANKEEVQEGEKMWGQVGECLGPRTGQHHKHHAWLKRMASLAAEAQKDTYELKSVHARMRRETCMQTLLDRNTARAG